MAGNHDALEHVYFFIILGISVSNAAAAACHGHNCNTEVDTAITNLDLHYNDKLCREIQAISCADHTITGDEVVCASDDNTYANQYVHIPVVDCFILSFPSVIRSEHDCHLTTYSTILWRSSDLALAVPIMKAPFWVFYTVRITQWSGAQYAKILFFL